MKKHNWIDPNDPKPLYLQIADTIQRAIAVGALGPGDRIPTVRAIADEADVNRNTAARALREIELRGVTMSRKGKGTFVTGGRGSEIARDVGGGFEAALDRLLIEAHANGIPFEELGWRLLRRLDGVRRDLGAAGSRR